MEFQGKPKKVFIRTFGCQMNEYDSEKILGHLRSSSYSPTTDPGQADLILLNTCAIREKAEQKVFSLLGSLNEIKASRPEVLIGVGGCMAQQQGAEILKRAKQVDLVFGTDNLAELPEMLTQAASGARVVRTGRSPGGENDNILPLPLAGGGGEPRVKANIAITKGCNNFCTFCVVPYTRGREVSRQPGDILSEAEALVENGVREITLLGQNVNSYRAGKVDFVSLLNSLNGLDGLERIRYTSPHPKDFNEDLIAAHQTLSKLCEHLHMPFQSGSDKILKKMRRNHKMADLLEKMEMIREAVPGIALSTDIIVGFPGETEADFQETLEVMKRIRFDHLYAFKYSPRSDTPAAKYGNQVPEQEKTERLAVLHDLHERILQEINQRMIGSRQEVLLEGQHPRDARAMIGRTRGYKSVTLIDCDRPGGELAPVEIVATRKFSLVGREIGNES